MLIYFICLLSIFVCYDPAYLQEVQNIQCKSSFVSFSDAFEPTKVEFAIDELRENSDTMIDQLKAMLEAAYRDKVNEYIAQVEYVGVTDCFLHLLLLTEI